MVVPPPPKPPTKNDDDDDLSNNSGGDDRGNDDGFDCDMKTPLVGHGTHKKAGRGSKKNVFRPTMPTFYSSIDESGAPGNSFDGTSDEDDNTSKSDESVMSLTSVLTNFRGNLMLPFVSDETSLPQIAAGLSSLTLVGVVLGIVMPKNPALIGHGHSWYKVFSSVIGYTYFVLWSVCFYPQVLLNFRRKSTKGLSNDFAILNLMGWSFYSAYLGSMYFNHEIQELYEVTFKKEKSSVQSNDVLFSVHAMILSAIYLIQIVYYGGKDFTFKLKPFTWFLVIGMGTPTVIVPILISSGLLDFNYWLTYFYVLSYFKITCTLNKYTKQVVLNFQRKSTSGWNIWYNFLECSGGLLSMMQIVFDSIDMHDLTGITGNLAKLILGVATLFFDAIFFTQHYILYPEPSDMGPNGFPASIIQASDTLVLSLDKEDDQDELGDVTDEETSLLDT